MVSFGFCWTGFLFSYKIQYFEFPFYLGPIQSSELDQRGPLLILALLCKGILDTPTGHQNFLTSHV